MLPVAYTMQPAYFFDRHIEHLLESLEKRGWKLEMLIRNGLKKVLSMGLCVLMLSGLCACDTSDVWVFSLNGEKIYEKEVAAFAFVYVTERNIRDNGQLEEFYEDTKTYEEFYKEELEEDIVSFTLLYKEAQKHKVKLSEEKEKQLETTVNSVMAHFDEKILGKYEVSKSDIENVCKMRMLGEAYLEALSNGEVEVSKEDSSELEEESDLSERYIKVYQVTFPTVELDDNGMVRTDAEGNLKKLSMSEIATKKEDATLFAESAKQGENMEILLESCEKDVSSVTKHLKYEDLELEYKTAVDKMTVGDISDVIESDYGYCVFKLIKKDDTEYADTMHNYQKEMNVLEVKNKEIERLRLEYAQENRGYKNTSLWNTIEMKDYIE